MDATALTKEEMILYREDINKEDIFSGKAPVFSPPDTHEGLDAIACWYLISNP
jgi:hypothetical protein